MMLLYVCKECGRWRDVSFFDATQRAINAFSMALTGKEPEAPPQGCQCPDGHGAMVNVSPEERIFAWMPTEGTRPVLLRPISEEVED